MLKSSILKKALLIGTTVAVAGSLIGTTLVASAQNSTSTPQSNTPTPAPTVVPATRVPATPRPDRDDDMHPRWWAHIFRQAARGDFDKFTGADLRYTDGANRLVVGAHPGTVARIGDNELMIKPNGGGEPVVYTFRPDTDSHLEEFKKHFRNIEIGDKVIIITVNSVAKWVIVVNERDDDGRKLEERNDKRIEKERENAAKKAENEKERAEKAREHEVKKAELEAKKATYLKEREAKQKELDAKKTEQAKEREAKVKELQEKAKQQQEQARQRAEEARKKAEENRANRGNATSTAVSNSNRT